MGLGALDQLAVTHAHTPSAVRPFFLTFRGTTYVNPKEAGAGRTRLLDLVHLSTAAKRIVVAVQCHKLHGEHKFPPTAIAAALMIRPCNSLQRTQRFSTRLSPSYPAAEYTTLWWWWWYTTAEYTTLLNEVMAVYRINPRVYKRR